MLHADSPASLTDTRYVTACNPSHTRLPLPLSADARHPTPDRQPPSGTTASPQSHAHGQTQDETPDADRSTSSRRACGAQGLTSGIHYDPLRMRPRYLISPLPSGRVGPNPCPQTAMQCRSHSVDLWRPFSVPSHAASLRAAPIAVSES